MNKKKKALTFIVSAVVILCIVSAVVVAIYTRTHNDDLLLNNSEVVSSMNSSNGMSNGQLTLEAAKAIALMDCKQQGNASIVFTKEKVGRENGRTVYELNFNDGVKKYEYNIDTDTGEIITASNDLVD